METFPWFPRGAVLVGCAYPSHITRCDMSPWCCAEYLLEYPLCSVAAYQMRSDYMITNQIRSLPSTPNRSATVGISGEEERKRRKQNPKIELTDTGTCMCSSTSTRGTGLKLGMLYASHCLIRLTSAAPQVFFCYPTLVNSLPFLPNACSLTTLPCFVPAVSLPKTIRYRYFISNLAEDAREGFLPDPYIAGAGCYWTKRLRPDTKGVNGFQPPRELELMTALPVIVPC